LCSADVDCGLVFGPGEFFCDGHVCAAADTGHGFEEAAEPIGVGVEGVEQAAPLAGFVLRQAGAERGGEVTPVGIEAVIGHFEHAADVGRLTLVEEEIG